MLTVSQEQIVLRRFLPERKQVKHASGLPAKAADLSIEYRIYGHPATALKARQIPEDMPVFCHGQCLKTHKI
jgi:hypothetical protein